MKRFSPLILSALITAGLAGLVAWSQHIRIEGLRDKIAAHDIHFTGKSLDLGLHDERDDV